MAAEIFHLPKDEAPAAAAAAAQLRTGGMVVIPTETIYGLTCNALDAKAVRALYAIKGRELDKPSAVFVRDRAMLEELALVDSAGAARVIEHLLPGPLTVILRATGAEMAGVVGVDRKIGIRMSSDSFVSQLVTTIGVPLIATSANLAGKPDCRTEAELLSQFANCVPLIILRPQNPVTRGSTVVDLTGPAPRLLREGTLAFAEVLKHAE